MKQRLLPLATAGGLLVAVAVAGRFRPEAGRCP